MLTDEGWFKNADTSYKNTRALQPWRAHTHIFLGTSLNSIHKGTLPAITEEDDGDGEETYNSQHALSRLNGVSRDYTRI